MITINVTLLLEICTGIGIICGTGVWVQRLLKPLTKPLEDMKKEISEHAGLLDRDTKELKLLKDQNALNTKTIHLLLEVNLAILEHLETGNATDKMAESKKKIQNFLIEN